MKRRNGLRQRSETNSHHETDLKLRRAYSKIPLCEMGFWLSLEFPWQFEETPLAEEVHHIFGGTSGRNDLVSNLVRLCKKNHDWCGRFPADGRIVCLWIKHRKYELIESEFVQCSIYRSIEGYLVKVEPDIVHDFVRILWRELKENYGRKDEDRVG